MGSARSVDPLAQALSRRAALRVAAISLFAACLAIAILTAVGIGALPIVPHQAIAILLAQVGLPAPWSYDPTQELVLMSIRLPRACLGLLVGASLAVSGAALQGLFRNPLADPGLVGVSTGAALAAGIAIVAGGVIYAIVPVQLSPFVLPAFAFCGGLIVTLLVYRIASTDGRTDVATMLLAGIAMNAIASAGIGILIFHSDDQELRDLNFWLLGSIGGQTWQSLTVAGPLILLPTLLLLRLAPQLNALVLGENEARHLGFDIERTKRAIIILVALTVGSSVALTGVIGFVGLVVPHLVRMVIGPDHRLLMPVSLLLGPALLLAADTFARTLVLPAELPIGILTSAIGGPFFLWLLVRHRRLGTW